MTRSIFDDVPRVAELADITPAAFQAEIARSGRPLVLRGAVADWPLVEHARRSPEALVDYLTGLVSSELADTVIAPPAARGRLLYDEDFSGLNHRRSVEKLPNVLRGLLKQMAEPEPVGISIQGLSAAEHFRGLEQHNSTELVPAGTEARLWIGNAVTVAPHFDAADNLACVAAGRRRFVLFPPDQVGNLYVGPFDLTPAGVPVSIVPLDDPDLDRWPRYRQALAAAEVAELGPGDAIYIPYLWWHGVQSLEPLNMLVNYWWYGDPIAAQHPFGALLRTCHSLFQHMPPEHRAAWRGLYEHYVFAGEPAEHLPEQLRGAAEPSPEAIKQLKAAMGALFEAN
jgi:cupin-like protein